MFIRLGLKRIISTFLRHGTFRPLEPKARRVAGHALTLHKSVAVSAETRHRWNRVPWPTAAIVAWSTVTWVGLAPMRTSASRINTERQGVSHKSCSPGPVGARTRYIHEAAVAVGYLVRHYWGGSPRRGHIRCSWNGYPGGGLVLKGVYPPLWERGMMVFAMANLYQATGSPILKQRLRAEWSWIKAHYPPGILETAGNGFQPECDDCGWNALTLLTFHKVLGNRRPLQYAAHLVASAFQRWLDNKFGGGMWYNDARKDKSLYQVGIVLSALKIYEATGNRALYRKAMACYQWMESHLLRPDGLYWCDYGRTGPVGKDRPNDIHQAGSVTYIGGNMGMGVIQATLYDITNQKAYRRRAIRVAVAIAKRLTRNGVYLDDRDAWTDGSFAGEWATKVLTLRGIKKQQREILYRTANSIYYHDRTLDDFYGGCWGGPAGGPGCRWCTIGSLPQQIMTSSSAVNLITAAALLQRAYLPLSERRARNTFTGNHSRR